MLVLTHKDCVYVNANNRKEERSKIKFSIAGFVSALCKAIYGLHKVR